MSVPRGTQPPAHRTSRVSARVPAELNDRLDEVVAELRRRGLAATRTELVELSIGDLTQLDIDDLEQRFRQWRASNGSPE